MYATVYKVPSAIIVSSANSNIDTINKNDIEHGRGCYCGEHGSLLRYIT